MKKSILIILIVILIDQVLKIYVKSSMILGEEYKILDWFYIHFTENNGMAFGLEFGGKIGKVILMILRISFVLIMISYVKKTLFKKYDNLSLLTFSLIIGGAIGNIIDGIFYGYFFTSSLGQISTFSINGNGYAPLMFGKVVDMFYFPLYKGVLPDYIPFLGGDYFIFFRPVFNFADTCISIGVFLLILFNKKIMKFIN